MDYTKIKDPWCFLCELDVCFSESKWCELCMLCFKFIPLFSTAAASSHCGSVNSNFMKPHVAQIVLCGHILPERPHVEAMWQYDLCSAQPDCVCLPCYPGQSCDGKIDE